MVKIIDIINNVNASTQKGSKIVQLCNEFLPFENILNLDQNHVAFPQEERHVSVSQSVSDIFLSKLATIEFGYNGWLFAAGSHKSITEETAKEAEKFASLYSELCGSKVPLAAGGTSAFMEVLNRIYNNSGKNKHVITSTTRFPGVENKLCKSVKYCFTASTYVGMESFLVHNAIGGIFFEGGFGTAIEFNLMLLARQRGSINLKMPIILMKRSGEDSVFYTSLETMQRHQKIYPSDLEGVYSVATAEEAIDIMIGYNVFKKDKDLNDIEHPFVRDLFIVPEERFL